MGYADVMRLVALLLLACTPPSTGSSPTSAPTAVPDAASVAAEDAGPALDAAQPVPLPKLSDEEAAEVLFGSSIPPGCGGDARVECLIGLRYSTDAQARELAIALYRETGDVAGVGKDEIMDGGFRGKIHLVPELPTGPYRKHLSWVLDATRDFESFFKDLYAAVPLPRYRWRGLAARFIRSVDRTTPSAYASPWTFSYNVRGSLLFSADGVRETLFHEFFHMNDADHGDWSPRHLSADYDAILKKCGSSTACLTPYAPNDTVVRGGTYYAFQQNNGAPVHEYGAELALRYYKEQRAMLRDHKLAGRAFKCGPPENARSWKALVDEFFGGRDLVAPCL